MVRVAPSLADFDGRHARRERAAFRVSTANTKAAAMMARNVNTGNLSPFSQTR
jgi:hypothetical protein